MKKNKEFIKFIINLIYLPEIIVLLLVANIKYKHLYNNWIICERGDEAKDNGYKLFKYMVENKLDENVYYIVDKNNKEDYERVKHLGKVIQYKSFEHKILFLLSSKLISTHANNIIPWNWCKYNYFKKIYKYIMNEKQYVFLQHGITKDDLSSVLGKKNTEFDLFICGAYPEYKYISQNFGYREDQVVYTGLARYDDLYKFNTKNYILIMPTWRLYLKNNENFLETDYYKKYQSILNNKDLHTILDEFNYNLVFYPHYEVQKYIKNFKTESSRIKFADKNQCDVQKLLKESKLLITDFSSVFFDFAYMKKPIIYYQFDKVKFFKGHYKKGYFSYEDDGFGAVVEDECSCVELVKSYFYNEFKTEEKYINRSNKFFKLKDNNNCKRIYDEISKLN